MYRMLIVVLCMLIASCGAGDKNDKTTSTPTGDQRGGLIKVDSQSDLTKKAFDPIEWKKASLLGRSEYAESLLVSNILIGKSLEHVYELLGKHDGGFAEDNSIFYRFETGAKLNDGSPVTMALYIKFDQENVVRSVIISD